VNPWVLSYDAYDPAQEKLREALCTVGNGYFASRGAAPECIADGTHYPGTYVAGYFNRLSDEISGRMVENESLVNAPNWLPLTFSIQGGAWFDIDSVEILEFNQELDLKTGVLKRQVRFKDQAGRTTRVAQRRFVHMGHRHLAALETTVLAEDWSGTVRFRSALDGRVENSGVERYRQLSGKHLVPVESGQDESEPRVIHLQMETTQSRVRFAMAAMTRVYKSESEVRVSRNLVTEASYVAHEFDLSVDEGEAVTVEKIVAVFGSRDKAIHEPGFEARTHASRCRGFSELLAAHILAWDHLWQRFGLEVTGDADGIQGTLNLHVFHLLQTVSANSVDLDAGVPARGLHGEAYRGHVFWDEVFIFPYLTLHLPRLTRNLLRYRYRRLSEARWRAAQAGYRGALYPWQSGSNGREETQEWHLNPLSGEWSRDNSHLQRHINIAVAYSVWTFYSATGDEEFMEFQGAEMLLETARFWASAATYNRAQDRYEILGVMGPDEYHDAYPDADEPGIDNNAYTNVMVVWCLMKALGVYDALPSRRRLELRESLAIERQELELWEDISRKMKVVFHGDGILSQFEGYGDLEELDWEAYRATYGDIQRLDRILGAEGDTPNRYKVSKQADALMLFYLLPAEEIAGILDRLGYDWSEADTARTTDYYMARTSHGSTLSRVVHSWLLARRDRERSWCFFTDALRSDVADIQGGTTSEGVHLGAMAGTVDLVQRCYTGIELRGDALWLNPALPAELTGINMNVRYRGAWLRLELTRSAVVVSSDQKNPRPCRVGVGSQAFDIDPGQTVEIPVEAVAP